MIKNNMQLKVGENIQYRSTVLISLTGVNNPPKFRNEFTDGEFVTQEEFTRIIRKKKLNQLFKN